MDDVKTHTNGKLPGKISVTIVGGGLVSTTTYGSFGSLSNLCYTYGQSYPHAYVNTRGTSTHENQPNEFYIEGYLNARKPSKYILNRTENEE